MPDDAEPDQTPNDATNGRRQTNKPPAGGPRQRIDWPRVRRTYIDGLPGPKGVTDRVYPTLNEVAEYHGINASSVRQRAAAEHWTDDREAAQLELDAQLRERRARTRADALTAIDDRAIAAGRMGLELVGRRLAEIAEAVERNASRPERDRAPTVIDAREVDALSKAAQGWYSLTVRSLGIDPETGGTGARPTTDTPDVRREMTDGDADRLIAFAATARAIGLDLGGSGDEDPSALAG